MNNHTVSNQIDLFSGQASAKISFTDWNGNIQEFEPRADKTPEQIKHRYIIKNALELMCKLLKQRENAFQHAARYDFNYKGKQYHTEILNDALMQMSLYDERHYKIFVITTTEKVLPELNAIAPHSESRLYYRYKLNINNLTAFFQKELKCLE